MHSGETASKFLLPGKAGAAVRAEHFLQPFGVTPTPLLYKLLRIQCNSYHSCKVAKILKNIINIFDSIF